MKLKDYRETYYFYSGRASDISRQLGFAGIALIWAFKTTDADSNYSLAPELFGAGILIVAALLFDLLQYVAGTMIWGRYSRYHEKRGVKAESNLDASRYLNWPGLIFFWFKIGFMLLAYVALLSFLWQQISSPAP